MIQNSDLPLCVDLDGTLVSTDTLFESAILLIKKNPLYILLIVFWLLKGKSFLKQNISSRVLPQVDLLPYKKDVIGYIKRAKESGSMIILTTASHKIIAEEIASHLNLFDKVIATNSNINIKGKNKANVLVNEFGEFGFDYMGDSKSDGTVWEKSNKAILINPSKRQKRNASKFRSTEIIETKQQSKIRLFIKQLRVHQWVKNILLILPLFLAHRISEPALYLSSFIAFVAFSLIASSVYLINDIFDLEADRGHPTKKERPFASGKLSLSYGLFAIPIIITIGFILSILNLNINFTYSLLIYLLLTSFYSLSLKKIYILDIFTLASLYTMRIFAGAIAVDVLISPWLIAFSMFIFLSLAIVKRYNELNILVGRNEKKTKGRGYTIEDISLLRTVGVASGYLSILVFTLYINSNEVIKLYERPMLLWGAAPALLYWITRIWLIANRNEMHEDPIVFTVRDPVSYIIGGIIAAIVIGASL